ncbi:MAG: hypothetical protein FWC10_03005 [Lentimicrobiaceae bacterium]|nr:hypothetical protein [Lentimicrobiaceae bacterium]
MQASIIRYFLILLFIANSATTLAQYHAVHEIDSVMDLSPYYLPTSYSNIQFIEFEHLTFKPVDTSMISTHLFDPLLKPEGIYQNLGLNGQAHQSIVFDYQREMGFVYQQLPYPLYFKKQSDLSFPKLKTTYSRVAYTITLPNLNELFADFSQYVKGVTIDFNFYAFSKGSFNNQISRNICTDFLLHYETPSSIYGFKTSFILNHLNSDDSGGLKDLDAYKNGADLPAIYNPKARSRIMAFDINLQNYVNIINKDKKYFGTFTYDFQLTHNTINYSDTEPDSVYYPHFDGDISNDSTRLLSVKNVLQWSNFKPFKELIDKKNFFHIAGGALHDYSELKYSSNHFNSLYLFARTHIRLFHVLDITGKISYSVYGYTQNDLLANAGISWAINREKEHVIGFNASFFHNTPEYVLQHVRSNYFQWDTTFLKQDVVQLKAFWNYEKYKISASYFFINNWAYLSEQWHPIQHEKSGNLLQLSAFVPFRYKNFGTTANLNLQHCTNDVIKVPLFAGKLSVFYIFELLKKRLKIQVGTDLMYNTTYAADGYLPVLHKFYYQNSQNIGDFVFWDANVTVQIDRINFFFRIANLLPPFMHYRNFTTPNFPTDKYNISIGITWRFFD